LRRGARPAQHRRRKTRLTRGEAGRAGRFCFVVGVDRTGQADALKKHGADIVVADLAELLDHS